MKKILAVIVCLLMVITFAGCGAKTTGGKTSNNTKQAKEKINGNCTVFECIKTLEITDTLDQVNEKMGFEGKKDKEEDTYSIYTWEVTKDSKVEIQFFSSGKSDIKIEFDKDKIANDKLDLSKFDEMKAIIQKGEMTLDKFSEMVGNVDGTLVEKSSFSNKYLWYKSSSNYLYGTFSTSSNKCTFVSGLRQ